MAINLSDFSIRYPEIPKYIWDSPTPYSDLMQIKKDRRNPEHTKRPLNAFMLFAKIQREFITANFSCNHSEISKALGKLWQDLSKEEKDPFISGGKTLVELHRLEYPDYKYRPRKKGQAKQVAPKSIVAKKSASRQKITKQSSDKLLLDSIKKERVYMTGLPPQQPYLTPDSPPYHEQMYPSGGSPTVRPASPLSSCVGRLSPASGLGLASPASHLHTPYSPVPSICSSSGYESEMSSCLTAHELSAALDEPRYDCWSPQSEPDMTLDLRDLEVTPLDEATLLNPLAMFPVLDLSSDDLDDLQIGL